MKYPRKCARKHGQGVFQHNRPQAVCEICPTSIHNGRSLFFAAAARTGIASLKKNDSGEMKVVLIILKVEVGDESDLLFVIVEYLVVVRVVS